MRQKVRFLLLKQRFTSKSWCQNAEKYFDKQHQMCRFYDKRDTSSEGTVGDHRYYSEASMGRRSGSWRVPDTSEWHLLHWFPLGNPRLEDCTSRTRVTAPRCSPGCFRSKWLSMACAPLSIRHLGLSLLTLTTNEISPPTGSLLTQDFIAL